MLTLMVTDLAILADNVSSVQSAKEQRFGNKERGQLMPNRLLSLCQHKN
jgi:hypothetical protein